MGLDPKANKCLGGVPFTGETIDLVAAALQDLKDKIQADAYWKSQETVPAAIMQSIALAEYALATYRLKYPDRTL